MVTAGVLGGVGYGRPIGGAGGVEYGHGHERGLVTICYKIRIANTIPNKIKI